MFSASIMPLFLVTVRGETHVEKKGFMSSEKISAGFSMQVSQTSEAELSFDFFPP